MKLKKSLLIMSVILFLFIDVAIISSANTDLDLSNNAMSIQVDVKDTKDLNVNFIPVDWDIDISEFINLTQENINFINYIYPLSEGKFTTVVSSDRLFNFNVGESKKI